MVPATSVHEATVALSPLLLVSVMSVRAGVGLPGTSGFIADDSLLHALWFESVASAVMMILASALLAVAILAGFSRAFLGMPVRQLAPELQSPERVAAVVFVSCLVALGLGRKSWSIRSLR